MVLKLKLTKRAVAGAAVLSLCVLLAVEPAVAAGDNVEGTVRKEVQKAIKADPGVGPALIRLVITYAVKTGRKDGVVSSAAAADATLPESTFEVSQLKDNFAKKNFTTEELVVLSGAHAVGISHLSSFKDRLNSTTATPIDGRYAAALAKDVEALKGQQNTTDPTELFNIRDKSADFQNASGFDATGVDTTAVGVLDNSFYHATTQNMVLLKSDWVLRTDGNASISLSVFRDNATKWEKEFAAAMAKLSKLPAEGTRFEIRKNCRATNDQN
ncbi:hypothetical protein E2562_010596 [Oryza meyeriana var. granulata]|uniref:Plant heme peroxidase family profile domain-containing protein n=1 Tax=Oryza meyeriana var. granulata TaxID=110450 RepID=A0A6G1BUD5_9ORYZ|nr:hypothetical protein E2562_010596 [Oryza meyeriana var. granulata]